MNSHVLAWLRGFLAALLGGLADGVLVGLGGSASVSIVNHLPVSGRVILYTVAVNTLIDVARFVKNNSDPWSFPVPPVPVVPPPAAAPIPPAVAPPAP